MKKNYCTQNNTTMTITELNAFLIACELVRRTGGNTRNFFDLKGLAKEIGIEGESFQLAIQFLVRKSLITGYGAGYTYYISDYGLDEVIKAAKYEDRPTDYFPSVSDIRTLLKINGNNLLL